MKRLGVILCCLLLLSCAAGGDAPGGGAPSSPAGVEWAIAIHGGAGSIPKTIPDERKQALLDGLRNALASGRDILAAGGTGLDAVETVIRLLEDDPQFNAGKGAVFNHDRGHELDASIMDGATMACGAVAGVKTVKNPISLARRVMENTRHVLLAGDGADRFAAEQGVEQVSQDYFSTRRRLDSLERAIAGQEKEEGGGTVGVVALDSHGNLAAGTSTGGLTNKMFGRVGDSPIVGAGTYARNATCAVSATGVGEEFIRHGVAHSISTMIEYGGMSLEAAARKVIHETLRPGDGGIIAVGRDGTISMEFNTTTMARGAADSSGRFEIEIWE